MNRSTTGDRTFLALLGLVAALAGAYGLARGFGALGAASGDQVLLDSSLRSNLVENAGWAGGAATLVALLVAWGAWRWLRRQVTASQSSLRQVRVATGSGGRTSVEAQALTDAIVGDLKSDPQVTSARARLVGHERAPAVELVVDLNSSAELAAVRHYLEAEVLARARRALDRPDLQAAVRIRLGVSTDRALQ